MCILQVTSFLFAMCQILWLFCWFCLPEAGGEAGLGSKFT